MYQISILSVWLAGLNGWLGYIFLADKKGWWQRLTRLSMHVVDGAGAGAGCIFGLAWLSLADGVSLNTLSNDGVLYLAWLGFWCIVWLTGLNWWLGNFEQEAVVYNWVITHIKNTTNVDSRIYLGNYTYKKYSKCFWTGGSRIYKWMMGFVLCILGLVVLLVGFDQPSQPRIGPSVPLLISPAQGLSLSSQKSSPPVWLWAP